MTNKCINNACVSNVSADFTKCTALGANGMCSEGVCQRLVAIRSAIMENAVTPYIQASTTNPQLQARGANIGPFETFLECSGLGGVAFRSYETKRFIAVHADGYVHADGGSTLLTATKFTVIGSNIRTTDGSGAYLQCSPLTFPEAGRLQKQVMPASPGFWENLPIEAGTWTTP